MTSQKRSSVEISNSKLVASLLPITWCEIYLFSYFTPLKYLETSMISSKHLLATWKLWATDGNSKPVTCPWLIKPLKLFAEAHCRSHNCLLCVNTLLEKLFHASSTAVNFPETFRPYLVVPSLIILFQICFHFLLVCCKIDNPRTCMF